MARWRKLSKQLLFKYLDGNVRDEQGKVTHPGYPEEWYRTVAKATGEKLRTHKLPAEEAAEREEKAKAKATAESVLKLLDARGLKVDGKAARAGAGHRRREEARGLAGEGRHREVGGRGDRGEVAPSARHAALAAAGPHRPSPRGRSHLSALARRSLWSPRGK